MIRWVSALLVGALVLGGCGSVSPATAMATWASQSNYRANARTLIGTVVRSASALRDPSSTSADLHTVCAVVYLEADQLNAPLPTPDARATALVSEALIAIGRGASECYNASASEAARRRSIAFFSLGLGSLSEATARIASVAAP